MLNHHIDKVLLFLSTLGIVVCVVVLHRMGPTGDNSVTQWLMHLGDGFAGAFIALATNRAAQTMSVTTPDPATKIQVKGE